MGVDVEAPHVHEREDDRRRPDHLGDRLESLNLCLVYLFGYPFRGETTVSERPFRIDIDIFNGIYDDSPAHASEKDMAKA